jgi:hypothetical protein
MIESIFLNFLLFNCLFLLHLSSSAFLSKNEYMTQSRMFTDKALIDLQAYLKENYSGFSETNFSDSTKQK